MKKPLKYALICLIAVLAAAMIVHVYLSFASIVNDPYTSAPASIAFLLIIPYALAIGACATVWIILSKKSKKEA